MHGLARGTHKAPCNVQQSVNMAGSDSTMCGRLARSTRWHIAAWTHEPMMRHHPQTICALYHPCSSAATMCVCVCVWLTPLQAAPDIADCCPAAPAARAQFCWPHPGIPRADLSDAALEVPAPDPQQPVDDFCLLVMHVEEVRAGGQHMCGCLAARIAWLCAKPTSAVHWG